MSSAKPFARLLVGGLLVGVGMGCASRGEGALDPAAVGRRRDEEYRRGRGREAAQEEIEAGRPCVYAIVWWGSKGRDEETGLPVVSFGSCIGQPSPVFIEGHNDRVKEYVRRATTRPAEAR